MKNVKKIIEKLAPSFSLQELETATANYKGLEKQDKRTAENLLEVTSESYVPEEFKSLAARQLRDGWATPEMARGLSYGLYQYREGDHHALMKLFGALERGHGLERYALVALAANQWEETHGKIKEAESVDEAIWAIPQLRAYAVSSVVRCLRDMSLERYKEEAKRNGLEWVKFGSDNANA